MKDLLGFESFHRIPGGPLPPRPDKIYTAGLGRDGQYYIGKSEWLGDFTVFTYFEFGPFPSIPAMIEYLLNEGCMSATTLTFSCWLRQLAPWGTTPCGMRGREWLNNPYVHPDDPKSNQPEVLSLLCSRGTDC